MILRSFGAVLCAVGLTLLAAHSLANEQPVWRAMTGAIEYIKLYVGPSLSDIERKNVNSARSLVIIPPGVRIGLDQPVPLDRKELLSMKENIEGKGGLDVSQGILCNTNNQSCKLKRYLLGEGPIVEFTIPKTDIEQLIQLSSNITAPVISNCSNSPAYRNGGHTKWVDTGFGNAQCFASVYYWNNSFWPFTRKCEQFVTFICVLWFLPQ